MWGLSLKKATLQARLNRPCHGFRRHLDEQANACEIAGLYENLMLNNFRKTAVLNKISIVNLSYKAKNLGRTCA